VGFLNPLLYSQGVMAALNDISIGNNGGYNAAAGWDPCTGLGSPNGANLLVALRGEASAGQIGQTAAG
jgi:kumamolisin